MRLIVASVLLLLAPFPAAACLPPPLGTIEPPPPTVEQRAVAIARHSKNVVYGVLTRGVEAGRHGRLRILHVYKGDLRVGTRVAIQESWGFDPPMCAGLMSGPPPVPKGFYGVFAWSGEPELNRVSDGVLTSMFEQGLIASANVR